MTRSLSAPQAVLVSRMHPLGLVFLVLFTLLATPVAFGLGEESGVHPTLNDSRAVMVTVDGIPLFPVRGLAAFPAKQRAQGIQKRIVEFARNPELSVDELRVIVRDDVHVIQGGGVDIVNLFPADAEAEGVSLDIISRVYLDNIRKAVAKFRDDRSPSVLGQNTLYAAGVLLVCGLLLWVVIRLFRWLDGLATRHVQRNIDKLANKSYQLVSGAQVWSLFAGLLRLLRIVCIVLLVYFLLNTVLGLFPWTRPLALALFALVLNPLESIASGFVAAIPDLAFLVILFLVVRYILKIVRVFFRRVETGSIRLENFDNDWAMPTYKILRILVVAFALVIAYPYIPGSDSMAFKGISVFLGVIFSLGSSSFISGMIAGLTMTYRGAFKEGDLVKIGEVTGTVTDIRLMVTRLRTAKNEIVVIPNSNILNTNVVNYSTMARDQQLILHTIVGIGYDTPWRQVEALLLLAAERTPGLLRDPPPFVLQKSLGDYAVNYELNAYCGPDLKLLQHYSQLHANIQDVFNEYGVQIMSPSYEADPETAKVVPREQWYAAPAKPPDA